MKSRLLLIIGLLITLTHLANAQQQQQQQQSATSPLLLTAPSRESIAVLRKSLTDDKTPASRREKFRQLAIAQHRVSDAEGALKTWRELIQQFPNDPTALEEAGDAMTDAMRYPDAAAFYEAWRDRKGASPEQQALAICKLAQLAEVQAAFDQARALYFSALPVAGADGWLVREIRVRIDDSFRRVEDFPGLAAAWQSYLASHGQDADAVLHMVPALSTLRRHGEAIAWLRKAAEWAPNRRDVKAALAQSLRDAGQPQEAVEISKALATAGTTQQEDLERLAEAQWQVFKKEHDEASKRAAIETWQLLAPPDAKDPQRLLHVADSLRAHSLPDDALQIYERATALAPDATEIRQRWADYLYELKRDDEARRVLRGLADGSRATPQNYLTLARIQFGCGDNAAAGQSVRAGLEVDPKHFELLSLQETHLARAGEWQKAADLAGTLLAAAPSLASAAQVEDNYAQALRQIGKQEDVARQYAQRLGKGNPLSETEARLLVALALRNGNLALAGDALDDAAKRFPDSAALTYDRAELERRRGHIEPSVAAFQRLATLQPEQKATWLRQIARAYLDENITDKALSAAERLTAAAPANTDSFVLAARIASRDRKFVASAAAFTAAIAQSPQPHALRLQMAGMWRQAGLVDQEREALLSAFEAATDPLDRLATVGVLADACARSGRLGDLIAGFRERRRTEKEGWRYAVYLSEIFRAMQNDRGAWEELAKTSGPRSRDLLFLTQSWRLSTSQLAAADRARFARLLAAAAPSTEREAELVLALLRSSDTSEAMAILVAHQDAIFADPMAWHDALLQAAAAGAGETVATLLQAGLARQAGDWRLRYLLAEARMRTGDFATAEKLLREVETTVTPAEVLPPSAAPDGQVDRSHEGGLMSGVTYSSGTGRSMGSQFGRRSIHGFAVRQTMAQISIGLNGVSAMSNPQFNLPSYDHFQSDKFLPGTPSEGADAALVMRSILAQHQGRGAEFVAEMLNSLKAQPKSERIARLFLVQALDPLLKEIAAEAAFPSADEELNAGCFEVLMSLSSQMSPVMGSVDVDWAALIPLVHAFLQRETQPETLLRGKLRFSDVLKRAGRDKEAQEVARDVMSHWEVIPRAQLYEVFDFASKQKDVDSAEKILAAMAEDRVPSDASFRESILNIYRMNLATLMLAEKADPTRALKLMTAVLRASYSSPRDNLSSLALLRMHSALRPAQEFPYDSRSMTRSEAVTWAQIFGLAETHGLLAPVKAALDEHIKTLPPTQAARARLARVCFLWKTKDRDTAIREVLTLADSTQNDELHLLAAAMLAEAGRQPEARQALARVSATGGDAGADKLGRLLALARAEKDTARATQIASQLADFPLSSNDTTLLGATFNELGLSKKATELKERQQAREQGFYYQGLLGARQQLERETQARHKMESVDLARAILARVSPMAGTQAERYYRRTAIDALRQFKVLADYTAELTEQLAENPASTETLLRLTEAFERENPAQAIEYCRQLVDLNPADVSAQLRYANLLVAARKTDDAIRVWEVAFDLDPNAVLGENFLSIFSGFKTARQTARLATFMRKAPPRGNPLENLAYGRSDVSNRFDQVAAELRNDGKLDDVILLSRASLERARLLKSPAFAEAATMKVLVPALLATGRKEEAAQELENYFLPTPPPRPPLGFEGRSTLRNWATLNYDLDKAPDLLGVPILRLAVPAGALDRLRAKAVAAAAAHPQDPERFLVLLIDILRREPSRLVAMHQAFDEAIEFARTPRNPMAVSILGALAQLLGEWPEGRALAMHVYEKAAELDTITEGWMDLNRAELALALQENDTAHAALKAWLSWLDRGAEGVRLNVYPPQLLTAADLLSEAGMSAEAAVLVHKAETSAEFPLQTHPELKRRVDEITNRLALLAGDTTRAQVTVWTLPARGDSRKTTVCWEIGPVSSGPADTRAKAPNAPKSPASPLTVTGRELPALDGKFTIEILHGPSESALQLIATIPAAKARGTWESPEPLRQGYITAVLREKGIEAYSQKSFVAPAPNLLTDPEPVAPATPAATPAKLNNNNNSPAIGAVPGWPGLNFADFITVAGGPNAGGHYVRMGLLKDASRSALVLPRIPLKPGQGYYYTSWLRSIANGGSCQLSGRFLDKDGAPLPTSLSSVSASPRGWWYACAIRLVPPRAARANEPSTLIPEKAAFFEPYIYTSLGTCDMTGLYLGEIGVEPIDKKSVNKQVSEPKPGK